MKNKPHGGTRTRIAAAIAANSLDNEIDSQSAKGVIEPSIQVYGTRKPKRRKDSGDWDFRAACKDKARAALHLLGVAIDSGQITRDTIRAAELVIAYAHGRPETSSTSTVAVGVVTPAAVIAEIERRRSGRVDDAIDITVDT